MEVKRTPVPSAAATPTPQAKPMEPPKNNFTSMSTPPVNVLASASSSAPVQNKKAAAAAQKEREKQKSSTSSSSTNVNSLKDVLPGLPAASGRSILDFGKANPGEETHAPSIVLHIPLNGESNKVVNFMRMAEEAYGWDALHPRLAAHRERKARIAAASAELAKQAGGRESGDEMSDDLSDNENDASNIEMGGMGNGAAGGAASGPEGAPVKARKKRINKEDEYDKDDDFVDDSELMWEEQAAASRDGFFVYSGPLIPEEPKPAVGYVVLACFLSTVPLLTISIVKHLPNVDVVAEAVRDLVAVVEVQLEAKAPVVVAGVVLVLGVVQPPGSRVSPRPRNSSVKRRRRNEKRWLR
jgi:hypothetical protein